MFPYFEAANVAFQQRRSKEFNFKQLKNKNIKGIVRALYLPRDASLGISRARTTYLNRLIAFCVKKTKIETNERILLQNEIQKEVQ